MTHLTDIIAAIIHDMRLNRSSDDIAAAIMKAFPVEPVLWVSSKQLPDLIAGGYVAARTTPEGNFDLPLYATPRERD